METVGFGSDERVHGTPPSVAIAQGAQRELTLMRSTAYGRPLPEPVDGLNNSNYNWVP
jgi:hypothetical protein